MRIKTFQGRTLEEVLPQIREQLGASAVVLGQRSVVNGGVGGFFGKRMVEVTAADSMPSDEQLIDLESRMVNGDLADTDHDGGDEPSDAERDAEDAHVAETTERLRAAMSMGRRGGLDVVDDWDPATDHEFAAATAPTAAATPQMSPAAPRVRPARDVAGYADLMLPHIDEPAADATSDPMLQAQRLVERAHANVEAQTQRVDANALGTYAPPAPRMPHDPATAGNHTFSATVHPAPQSRAHVTSDTAEAVRGDLGLAPGASSSNDAIAEAIAAAVDVIDLKAMAALRQAMNVSRTSIEAADRNDIPAELVADTDAVSQHLLDAGVDHDVVTAIVDTVVRHRRPFSAEQNIRALTREVIEQHIDVSSGFPRLSRTWRMAFVGAGSSGKSTVVAKVAQGYQAAGLRVAIVAIMAGTQRATGGSEQALQNAGVDVRYVASPEQASEAATAFATHDLVLVDTPGSIYLDAVAYDAVRACLDAIGIDDVQVVVPLTTSTREAASLIDAFRPLGANRVVVSRVDESRFSGQLINYGFRLGLPMTFLSDGPRVPEDLRAASAREIVDLVLPADAPAS